MDRRLDSRTQGATSAEANLVSAIRQFSGHALDNDDAVTASQALSGFMRLLASIDAEEEAETEMTGECPPRVTPARRKVSIRSRNA